MKCLLKKIFGNNNSKEIVETTVKDIEFNKVNEQIEIYSGIDKISDSDLRLLAANYYCGRGFSKKKDTQL